MLLLALPFPFPPLLFAARLFLALPGQAFAFQTVAFGLVAGLTFGFHAACPFLFIPLMLNGGLPPVVFFIRLVVVYVGLLMQHYAAVSAERQYDKRRQGNTSAGFRYLMPFFHREILRSLAQCQ
ncbi:hypothetical protein LJC36_05090 [Desulfovibrio sp. OttesenSCG-928-C14]|nr:hypothetical protein [Desulfovibrio sp. OttesenSCG-928-C14]